MATLGIPNQFIDLGPEEQKLMIEVMNHLQKKYPIEFLYVNLAKFGKAVVTCQFDLTKLREWKP